MPKTDIDDIEGNTMADITIMTTTWLLRDGVDAAFDARVDLVHKTPPLPRGGARRAEGYIDADILAGNWSVIRENTIHYYYHFDGLGSVAAVSDQNGHVVETYRYSVYGETEIRDSNFEIRVSSLCKNPYMFTARRLDTETGLYYYRARIYSPNLGRFLQTDPIGYEDSMCLYQYCLNNTIRFSDPYGMGVLEGVISWLGGGGYNPEMEITSQDWNDIHQAFDEGAYAGTAMWADAVIPFVDPYKDVYTDSNGNVYEWCQSGKIYADVSGFCTYLAVPGAAISVVTKGEIVLVYAGSAFEQSVVASTIFDTVFIDGMIENGTNFFVDVYKYGNEDYYGNESDYYRNGDCPG